MEALEFLKERKRMCKLHRTCVECPLGEAKCVISGRTSDEDYERVIAIVELWSKEHPRKTRQSVFLEQYPNAKTVEGALAICPYNLGLIDKCKSEMGRLCPDCRREFWMQEVE